MKSITINTTHGDLEFIFVGNLMNVRNDDTGETLYSGTADYAIVNDLEGDLGESYATRQAQEWANNFYGPDMVF